MTRIKRPAVRNDSRRLHEGDCNLCSGCISASVSGVSAWYTFYKSFQDKNGAFCGLSQFVRYFESKTLIYSISNTFFIAIVSTVISVGTAFFFPMR